jgi:quercetin dioxygenase-like cupin family protein
LRRVLTDLHSTGEGFYVLQGELRFQVPGEMLTGGAGTFAFAAAGVPHTFANRSEREARLPVLCAPAGFEM